MLWLIITITIGSIVLLTLHTGLALLILGLWAAHAVLISLLGRRVKQRAAESARQASHVTETIREVLTAAPFIKASGQERLALETIDCYVDWDPSKGTGARWLLPCRNAPLTPGCGWYIALWAEVGRPRT